METKTLRRTGLKRRRPHAFETGMFRRTPSEAVGDLWNATLPGALGRIKLYFWARNELATRGNEFDAKSRRSSKNICTRCRRTPSLTWIVAIALVLISRTSPGLVAGDPVTTAVPPQTSSRLCAPTESARAYVTTLASEEVGGQALGARVLAQSLRSAGAKGDIVVLVPLDRVHGKTVDSLRRDGLTVHIVPRGLQTAGGEIASEDLMTKIFLWSLTAYDRVVYLDPRSLIQKNPDALFACEGFCAAGALTPGDSRARTAHTHGSSKSQAKGKEITRGASGTDQDYSEIPSPVWQPSTSVMVLEPSISVHNAMLNELRLTTSVGRPLEAQVFLSTFLEAGDQCTRFEDLGLMKGPGQGSGKWQPGATDDQRRKGIGADSGGGQGEAGYTVESALQPVVLVDGANAPRCTKGRARTPTGVCRRLPYTYAAPASDFHNTGKWRTGKKGAPADEDGTEAHIIHFADEDAPWKRLAYLHKPLFWKWNKIREQLQNPYGQFFSPWLFFLIPCIMLAFARVYYKTAGLSSVGAPAGAEESPSKKRILGIWSKNQPSQTQPAISSCGEPGAHSDSVGVSAFHSVEKGVASAVAGNGGLSADVSASGAVPGSTSGSAPCTPVSSASVCLVQSVLVMAFGLVWFRATRVLTREVVDVGWHPLISIAVYNAWLCCALVLGLYVMDYSYYVVITRARTLWRDALAVMVFVQAVSFLHSRKSYAWPVATGMGVIALGFGHGSRPEAVRRLTTRMQFRCITGCCVVEALVSLAVCYSGASVQDVGSRSVHDAAGIVQMVFTALVYASVFGTRLVRMTIDGAGIAPNRSCPSRSRPEPLLAVSGTPECANNTNGLHHGSSRTRGHSASWSARLGALLRDIVWQRRVVVICLTFMILWRVSTSFPPRTPSRRLDMYQQVCLGGKDGFVEAGGKRLSKVCGPEQALLPMKTDSYFEAFRQDKVCLKLAGGGFLTLGRVHVAQSCTPENQFVFQQVQSPKSKSRAEPGSPDALSSAPAAGAHDAGDYCVYNPTKGFYLSAESLPRSSCGAQERWRLHKAPRVPGTSGGSKSRSQSTASTILHPDFLSQGPLHTLYGYLAVTTAILVARAIFAKLASLLAGSESSRGNESNSGGNGVGSKNRHSVPLARQRSRRLGRSRSRNNSDAWFGDAGYAGDAEAGGAGFEDRDKGTRYVADGYRSPSVSPVARLSNFAWGLEVPAHDVQELSRIEGQIRAARSRGVNDGQSNDGRVSSCVNWESLLGKLFSALCMCCDATLLAGLWCLLPTHLAQALSALTRDHHFAIQQGLSTESPSADSNDLLTRGLEGGVLVVNLAQGAVTEAAEREDATFVTCENISWWVMSGLLRWHLVLLLVAFCHLHAAAAATASASIKGRDRRTGKRMSDRLSFWGLRAGEHLAMRLRTSLGVLTMFCVVITTTGAGIGGNSLLGLHVHPAWKKCAPAAGLDGSWGGVSPLLAFAVLAAVAGVYIRAGAVARVRVGAVTGLVAAAVAIGLAVGREYLLLGFVATAMEWTAWVLAGLLTCVCYQRSPSLVVHRESSGSSRSTEDTLTNGTAGARLRGRDERRNGAGGGRGGVEAKRKRESRGVVGRATSAARGMIVV